MHGTHDPARRFAKLAALGFEPVAQMPMARDAVAIGGCRTRVVHRRPAMGTLVSVATVVASAQQADHAVGRAWEEMDRLIGIFSHYDSGTAASLLNSEGRLDLPPPELVKVAERAWRYWQLTRGGFDISVAPVVELFRQRRPGGVPTAAEMRAALELVGAEKIDVSRRRILFRRQGMRVTLDGIAKGFIVDAMARVLERHGITDFLVEAGGDIRVRGTRDGGLPWRVAVQDPAGGADFPAVIELAHGAVATSGSYEEYYDADREHHHIVDAESGRSPQEATSATVIAPTAIAADALATSLMLVAPRAGVRLVAGLPGCECLIVAADGKTLRSDGWLDAAPA